MPDKLDFESLVSRYYSSLYQFAFSLTRTETEASDLTQQTFYVWATKGHQLRDVSKVKTWLFTTLHREFLEKQRRQTRFPHFELNQIDSELPNISPEMMNRLDSRPVLQALTRIQPFEPFPQVHGRAFGAHARSLDPDAGAEDARSNLGDRLQ